MPRFSSAAINNCQQSLQPLPPQASSNKNNAALSQMSGDPEKNKIAEKKAKSEKQSKKGTNTQPSKFKGSNPTHAMTNRDANESIQELF